MRIPRKSAVFSISLGLSLALGCSGRPPALKKPDLNPAAAAALAVSEADKNGDESLSRKELGRYPALLKSLSQYDANGDGAISADEIEKELQVWVARGAAIRSLTCDVTFNGRPLSGALVEFSPEPFMGDAIKPCFGTTDEEGRAVMSLAKEDLPADLQSFPGIHLGIYRIRVTHPKRDIPTKYNKQTTLGEAIGPTTLVVKLNLRG